MLEVMTLDGSKCSTWFEDNYGFENSSIHLAKIINNISGTNYKAVAFEEWRKPLKKVARKKEWI